MNFTKTRFVRSISIAVMATCSLFSVSSHAKDNAAAACDASMIGSFKIVEKRSAQGSSKSDDGDRIKISRNGKSYSFSFLDPDGKAALDDDGKPNVGALEAMDPVDLFKFFTGKEDDKEAIAEAKKKGLSACGLKGTDGYFIRVSDKENTSFAGNFGSGFGSLVVTLEKAK